MVLVALASTMCVHLFTQQMGVQSSSMFTSIFASWKENVRLIRLSAYSTAIHLVLNLITLVCLLVALAPTVPCTTGRPRCSKLVAAKPAWDVLSAFILTAQLCEPDNRPIRVRCTNRGGLTPDLSLIVFSYFLSLKDRPWRPYVPEISSRSLSTPHSYTSDYKHLLSNPEPYHNVEMGAIGSATTTLSFSIPEPEPGYGGGMRTYEEAEQNEKARLRREMETEGNGAVSFPIPSTSDTGILTPLGHQWRDGDLPPYAS